MKNQIKQEAITIRTSEEQKEFLQKQADIENRTITAIINIALSKQYPEYEKLFKKGRVEKNEKE